jgi:hypothetical protein
VKTLRRVSLKNTKNNSNVSTSDVDKTRQVTQQLNKPEIGKKYKKIEGVASFKKRVCYLSVFLKKMLRKMTSFFVINAFLLCCTTHKQTRKSIYRWIARIETS